MSDALLDESLLARAHQHAVDFLRGLPERFVGAPASRDELRAGLAVPLTDSGESGQTILDALVAQSHRGVIANAGPRYFGFVIGGSLPPALAADWLVSTWDQNPGLFATSPITSVVEEIAAEWLLDLFDLPRESGVGFATGCQMANFTGIAAGRHAVLRDAGWNVEENGLAGAPRVNIVTSAESHVTIDVALRFLGFGTKNVHRVASDEQGRMRADALRELLATLTGPTIVCAQAGNVNTGAFDPLREIGEAARKHGAWLHVDGAFGLWARTSESLKHLADGIELADSWATDGHKWLNVPYDCGIVIVRDRDAQRASMASQAAYLMHTNGRERDPFEYVPEFSRRSRGIPVYAALRYLGTSGVAAMIENGVARAQQMADLLRRDPRVQILTDVVLNQVLVRFGDSDELTRAVVTRVQREGTCWLGGTTWHGMAAMRVSVSHWATTAEDIEKSAAAILRCIAD